MAVMSPQPPTATEQKASPAAPTPTSAVVGSTASDEAIGMDLDLHGTNKVDSTTASLSGVGSSPSKIERAGDRARSPFVNGNATIKGMNAPPSPPIPTPPLHAANDNSDDLSDFHITSPDGSAMHNSNGAEPDSSMENGHDGEKSGGAGGDESANMESEKADVQTPAGGSFDRAMADSAKSARERDEEDGDERPLKRAKTDDTQNSEPATSSASTGTLTDWTGPMTAARHNYVLGAIRSLRRMKTSRQFNMPVDTVKFNIPHYYDVIKEPMDLQTIERKLHAFEYTTVEAFVYDFNLIVNNCLTFNGAENAISQEAKYMESSFQDAMKGLPSEDVVDVTKPKASKKKGGSKSRVVPKAPKAATPQAVKPPPKPKKEVKPPAQSPTVANDQRFGLHPSGVPQVRRNSEKGDGRPKREIHPPASKDLPYMKPRRKHNAAELKFCGTVLKELLNKKNDHINFPFKEPVDPVALNIPDYFKIIKNPMDLGTIKQKLNDNHYENATEFEADIRLMFNNCYKFNPAQQPVHQMGKRLEEVFDILWKNKPVANGNRSQSFSQEPDYDESEEEGGEEEEEEVGQSPKNIDYLEKKVAEMQNEIAKLKTQKKPAAQSKKKSTTGGSGGRKASNAGPAKKPSSKKVPYMTMDQKTELSERINLLSPEKCGMALEIIRKNMPHLRDSTGEIELDIDELDPQTLHKLYTFVNKHAPPLEASYKPPPPPPQAYESKSKSKAAVPKPRKNKPMSAIEQEEKIQRLQAQVHQFDNPNAHTPIATHDDEDESSDDDVDSASESEEE